MDIHELESKIHSMVDDLQGLCSTVGLSNTANEEVVVTSVFLYKFLNDKFMYNLGKFSEEIDVPVESILKNEDDMLDAFYEYNSKELNSIPRNPQKLIRDYNAVAVVESDLFIQLMMDAYAYMVWPYMCPGEYMEVYSGYDPAWIFAHSPAYWVQEMLEENVIPPSSRLLRMNGDIDWVTEEEANDILLWLVPQTMAHYGMREVISIAEEYRCFEDFDFRASNQKKDFYRKWYHTQTKHPQISLDGFKDDYAEEHDGLEWDIEDESSNFENESTVKVLAEQFMETLSEKDKKILQLRLEGYTMEEVAEKLGYANHSGVLKRLRKIGQAFEKYADVDYGFDGKRII